jgi:uncharacterized protein YcbK (DUF882 family)
LKLTENFNLSEFQSKDGSPMPDEVFYNIQKLANQLQTLRDYICYPIIINSGYRSPAHNKAVGGVENSYHTLGMACDIRVAQMHPIYVKEAIEFLISEGSILQGGLGLYDTFVHYDFRGKRVRW